jgi:hypothetical protein
VGEQAQAPSTEEVQVFIDAIQAGVQHAGCYDRGCAREKVKA